MSILEANNVSIRYMTGDFKEIGLKEYVMRRIKHDYHVVEFWADRNISFTLEKGDMLGIIGTNGAGKSTLLKAISGIMEPTSGWIKREGTIAALLELGSGFDGELTVRENTYLRGAMLGYTRKFMDETYDQIIDFAELREFENRPFKQLSSGMKSRLAFSIASLVKPDILILDEVLSVGDGAFRQKSEAKMREIIGGGATTILVSHSIEQVRALCNKVLWIDKGEMIAYGENVEEICDNYEKFLKDKKIIRMVAPEKSGELSCNSPSHRTSSNTREDCCDNKDAVNFMGTITRRIFYLWFLCLPVLVFFWNVVQANTTTHLFDQHGVRTAILVLAALGISFFSYKYRNLNISKCTWWLLLAGVCIAGIALRAYFLLSFNSVPSSDMACVYNVAAGIADTSDQNYILSFPYLWNEAVILKMVFSAFGVSYLAGKILNVLVAGITILFLGMAGKYIFNGGIAALLPAMFFAFHPALAIYCAVLTIEHFSMLALAMLLYFVSRMNCSLKKREKKKIFAFSAMTGLALGLFHIFKPVGFIVIIAMVIAEIYYFRAHFTKQIKLAVSAIFIMTVFFCGSTKLYQSAYCYETGKEFPATNYVDVIYHGLIAEGGGSHNSNVKAEIAKVHSEYGEEANAELLDRLFKDIQGNLKTYRDLLWKKAKESWDIGWRYIYWTAPEARYVEYLEGYDVSEWDEQAAYEFRVESLAVSQAYYLVISICLIGGILVCIIKPRENPYTPFLSAIIIFGMALLLLLMETNGRYKSIFEPALCVCIGESCFLLGRLIDSGWQKISAKLKLKKRN